MQFPYGTTAYERSEPFFAGLEKDTKLCHLYLTGSRYFGTSRPESDWDFFTQHYDGIENHLRHVGFKKIMGREEYKYLDSNTIQVWEKFYSYYIAMPLSYENLKNYKVQIQLVKDEAKKLAAQNLLTSLPFQLVKDSLTDRKTRSIWWEWAYNTVEQKSVPIGNLKSKIDR